ncbi:MAG: PaaI family thioesterase [Acidobacteria bacterium]|nr:MAG: PaaI family thioesterase [Acidobacteriota bacterium]
MSQTDLDPRRFERARSAFRSVAYAKFLGLEMGEVGDGTARVHLDVRDELLQYHGVVHGGAIASLIDTASAFAVLTRIDLDDQITTTDLTIHYLRPISSGRMTATARIVRGGRRLFVLSVDVSNDSGALVATAVTTYIRLQ